MSEARLERENRRICAVSLTRKNLGIATALSDMVTKPWPTFYDVQSASTHSSNFKSFGDVFTWIDDFFSNHNVSERQNVVISSYGPFLAVRSHYGSADDLGTLSPLQGSSPFAGESFLEHARKAAESQKFVFVGDEWFHTELITDANAVALAELTRRFSSGLFPFERPKSFFPKNVPSRVVASAWLGEGIGGGFAGRDFLTGQHHFHPEIGHAVAKRHPVDTWPGVCPYHDDCFESLMSSKRLFEDSTNSIPLPTALRLFAHYAAQFAYLLTVTFSPDCIVLSGPVIWSERSLIKSISEEFTRQFVGTRDVTQGSYFPQEKLHDGGNYLFVARNDSHLFGAMCAAATSKNSDLKGT